jgi:acetyl/propionyl-CoA carboxylase alpha subunit
MSNRSIKKVFIANRGEIARRLAETAKKLSIEVVCICEGTPPSYLLGLVDEFVFVEEENVALYLNAEAMLSFAKKKHCDAIHPGFGFLAENADFAELVEKSGLVWIGPRSDVIKLMADKSGAREIAEKMNVPCLSGLNRFVLGNRADEKNLEKFCEKASFPLLIKAAFGGGGKGMRVAKDKEELHKNLEAAAREAKSSFGNDTLVIEEYVPESRHVEVQVIADSHGQIKILGDRDCSVQRRHQKIIEEAPAPHLSETLRTRLHEASYKLAKGIEYTSCGTVEFLVPWSMDLNSSVKDSFYFLEMNTRLQVEHPVTEEIFDTDIVELQFQVAEGKALTKEVMAKTSSKHSIEARIYLEDPKKNFLPSPGLVAGFVPFHQKGIRWEVGIDTVDTVTGRFDPMVAKLIATASNRKEAIHLIESALQKTFLPTVASNQSFLSEVFRDKKFLDSAVSTSYLNHYGESLLKKLSLREEKNQVYLEEVCDKLISQVSQKGGLIDRSLFDVDRVKDLSFLGTNLFSAKKNESPIENQLVRKSIFTQAKKPNDLIFYYSFFNTLMGKEGSFLHLTHYEPENKEKIYFLGYNGFIFKKIIREKRWLQGREQDLSNASDIKSEVPGKIIKILIKPGERVSKNQSCFILESMKMEFDMKASRDCILSKILVKEGDQVEASQVLAKLEAPKKPA